MFFSALDLHFQQRTTRKCLTLVQGLPVDLDLKKIVRSFKKVWCCNGTTHEHEEWGSIIQLQGDHRRDIMKFLIEEGICTKEQIKVHGYWAIELKKEKNTLKENKTNKKQRCKQTRSIYML